MYVGYISTKDRASQVVDGELSCNIRPCELDDDLFTFRFGLVLQSKSWKLAISGLPVVDVGEKESWSVFGGEKDSNVDTIFERCRKEGVR